MSVLEKISDDSMVEFMIDGKSVRVEKRLVVLWSILAKTHVMESEEIVSHDEFNINYVPK